MKDLKGKKVAGPRGTVLHQLLIAALIKEGMSVDDVEFLSMDQPAALSAMLSGTTPQVLRKMGDTIKDMKEPVIAVLASVNGEKGNLVCACSAPARDKGAHAGKIVQRVAAVTGGKGGGKPDSAMAGIGKTYMVDEALMALDGIAAEFLKED